MNPSIESPSTKTAERQATRPARSGDRDGSPDRAPFPRGSWDWLAYARRPDLLPGLALAARPCLLILTAGLLVGLCAALATWSARPGPAPAGNDLRADTSSINLTLTHAEAPPCAPIVVPPAQSEHPLEVAPVPIVEAPAPPVVDAPGLPAPVVAVESLALPAPEPMRMDAEVIVIPTVVDETIAIRIPHRGDSPMMHNWKLLGLQTILAGALTVAPAQAGDQKTPPAEPNKDDVVVKSLGELKKSIELLNETIKGLKSDTFNADLKATKAQSDVEELKKQIAQLQKDLDELRKTVSSRTSFSIQPDGKAVTGRLRLVNTYTEQVTILVNGKAYRVASGETRLTEALPAGTFTYEVLGIQGPRSPQLAANETFTINVHTR